MNTIVDRHAHKQGDDDQVGDIHLHAEEGHAGQHPEGGDTQGKEGHPGRFEAPKVQERQPNNRQHGVYAATHVPLLHVPDRIEGHDRRTSNIGIDHLQVAYKRLHGATFPNIVTGEDLQQIAAALAHKVLPQIAGHVVQGYK